MATITHDHLKGGRRCMTGASERITGGYPGQGVEKCCTDEACPTRWPCITGIRGTARPDKVATGIGLCLFLVMGKPPGTTPCMTRNVRAGSFGGKLDSHLALVGRSCLWKLSDRAGCGAWKATSPVPAIPRYSKRTGDLCAAVTLAVKGSSRTGPHMPSP